VSRTALAAALAALVAAAALPAAATLAATAAATATAATRNPRPATIPALRQWTGSRGNLELPRSPRIVVSSRRLLPIAGVLASDLRALHPGRHVTLVVGGAQTAGDIRLRLGPADPQLGAEGYSFSIRDTVTISAPSGTGVFYGTRTLLQLLHAGTGVLPRGRARDWPRYPERGLMIDLGRRVYPASWIETEIRQLAYLKLNLLHLHLTDDQRWGIVSRTHPELASPHALTTAEVRAILAQATRYHVTVVPEIDMPGHVGALLAKHPDLELKVASGASPPSTPESRKLDIGNPAALALVHQLLDEYLALFPGRYWDLGGDEYLTTADQTLYPQLETYATQRYGPGATAKDAILGYFNWVDGIVRSHHKTLRAWHDELNPGGVVKANPDIVADWWINFSPADAPATPWRGPPDHE
jgi:hexosaminidase